MKSRKIFQSPPKVTAYLHEQAAEDGVSMSDLVVEAIRESPKFRNWEYKQAMAEVREEYRKVMDNAR